ncbi:MAG: nuclear transport factor 2 family protein [Candidatus Acidiferrum sp.]
MKLLCAVAGLLFAVAIMSATASPQETSDSLSAEVLAAENARTAALVRSDVPALEKILADDLTYIHASGKVDTKTSMLEAIRSGQIHYISWQAESMHVRVLGDTAVLNGEYLVRVTDRRVQPDPFDVNIFILSVYAKRSGRWQQIAWQSTRDVALSPLPTNH